MPGSGLGALVEGFYGSIDRQRAEAREREIETGKREAQILQSLAESDDPEIRSMAIAGMLELASPRSKAKGLRGFLGEMEGSATLPKIRALLATPVQEPVTTPGLPSRAPTPGSMLQQPPRVPEGGRNVAAMAEGSLVTGTPPPSPQGLPAVVRSEQIARGPLPPPGPAFGPLRPGPAVGRTDTVSRPRQVFLAPEERLRRDTIAREQAEVEGEVAGYIAAGMSREQALELVKQSRMRRGGLGSVGTPRIIAGMSKGQKVYGIWDPVSQRVLDQTTRQPLDDFAPATSGDLGDAFEIAAREAGFASGTAVPPAEIARVRQMASEYLQGQSYARGTGTGQAQAEKPLTLDQQLQHTRAMQAAWFRLNQPIQATRRQVAALDAGMAAVERGDIAAGSEAVIVTFEKILDALSVVRESEYLRPLQNQSLIDRVTGAIERLRVGGAGMPAEQLKSYARLAKEIASDVEASVAPAREMLRTTAVQYKLNPDLIVGPSDGMAGAPPPPPGTPPPAATTPPPAAEAAGAPGGKTTTLARVQAYATARRIPVDVARRALEAQGYRIVDAP